MGFAYISFALGGGILGSLMMPFLHLWPGTKLQKQRRCQALTGAGFWLFHWYLHVLGFMSYRPPARDVKRRIEEAIEESARRGGPPAVMVVANHPTLIDTTAIMASYPYLIVMAKTSTFRFPLLRLLFWFCGHTEASSQIGGEAVLANQLIERMKNGESVLLFPEATRSPDEGPRLFRRGPFELALRAGVPIQPIVIESGPGLLKGGTAWYNVPSGRTHYELSPLNPVFPDGLLSSPPPKTAISQMDEVAVGSTIEMPPAWDSAGRERRSTAPSGRELAQLVFDRISKQLHKNRYALAPSPGDRVPASSGN